MSLTGLVGAAVPGKATPDGQGHPIPERPGTPGRARTCDLRIRNPLLYPTELQGYCTQVSHSQHVMARGLETYQNGCARFVPALPLFKEERWLKRWLHHRGGEYEKRPVRSRATNAFAGLVVRSTLTVQRRGRLYAELRGEVTLHNGHRMLVYERLAWDTSEIAIIGYSYEVWRGTEQLYWYDSQPHPDDAQLAATHPHHKHVPPDMRRNRTPAPGMSFTSPNLSALIEEAATC